MKTLFIEFVTGNSHVHNALVLYRPADGHKPAVIESISFKPSLKVVSLNDLKALVQSIENAMDMGQLENQEHGVETVGNSKSNLPVTKMNFMQGIAHVFKGGGGAKGMISRVDQIRKMAEGEMTEKEKEAAKGLVDNLQKFIGK